MPCCPLYSGGSIDSILVVEGYPDIHALGDVLRHHGFQNTRLYRIKAMPLDGRHNSKIDRQALVTLIHTKQLKAEKATIGQGLNYA